MTEEKTEKEKTEVAEEKPKGKGKAPKSGKTDQTDAVGPAVQTALDTVKKLSADERKGFITAYVGGLSVLELSDQVKALEEAFGVSAAPVGMMMAAAPGTGEAAGAAEPEQTAFDVILKEVGDKTKRVQVIKAVRDVLSVALKDAKALVDGAPGKVKEGASREEAEKIKTELEAAGATVELR